LVHAESAVDSVQVSVLLPSKVVSRNNRKSEAEGFLEVPVKLLYLYVETLRTVVRARIIFE
jgi:hypothetical protein